MSETIIKIDHVSKEYRLGAIGGTTLRDDLQRLSAKLRGKEDPTARIGTGAVQTGQRFLALDDVSFEVKKGEALGIIGHNGAGKSTLLKLLSRVTAPTKGTISYNGRIASMLEVGTGFHPELTGRENVYMNGAILGMTKAEIDRKFDEIVAFAEMEQFIDTPVKRYSSGMYVKLAFAVAAHLDSEIMVMDEVLAVGDMKFQQKCLGKMGNAANNEGKTVLYVSHNMNTIRQLCTRCIVLDHGKVVFDGDVEKAIEVYMDITRQPFLDRIELDDLPRSDMSYGTQYRMTELCFRDSFGANIPGGEKMRFSLRIHACEETDKICLRTMVCYGDGTPVGMATTCVGAYKFKKGSNCLYGVINTNVLAPGEYKLKLALYFVNEEGTELVLLDVLDKVAAFCIEEGEQANKMKWLHQWWGHTNLGEIKIEHI